MLRAQLAMARGRVDEALADLAKIPDAHALAPQARLRAGQLELRRDRLRAAEEAFLAASRLDPDLVQARRELIYIYGMQGRRAELDAQFRALAKLTPLTFDNALHWGLMSHESWQPDKVTEELGRFVQADPTDRWSRLAWAGSLRRIGRVDDAWKALEPLPDSDPEARALRRSWRWSGATSRPPRRCWPKVRPTTRAWPGSGDAWRWASATAPRPCAISPWRTPPSRGVATSRWAWPRRGP